MSKRWRGRLVQLAEMVLVAAFVILVVPSFVSSDRISGPSMETPSRIGRSSSLDKISPLISGYNRGNVIVFELPAGYLGGCETGQFIKRLIGLPGDLIQIHLGSVFVTGAMLAEPYAYSSDDGTTPEEMDPEVLASHVCRCRRWT